MKRHRWSAEEDVKLRTLYSHSSTQVIARAFGVSVLQVYNRAQRLGLHKSAEYLASPAACRLRRPSPNSVVHQFKTGHVPANKGLRRPGWSPGRMKDTQFKKGQRSGVAAKNWCPIGTIRPDPEGFLRIKVREGKQGEAYGFGNTKIWPLLNRHVWERQNGPIPAGHIVAFKDGDRTNCDPSNLELLSLAENMRRNSIHRLPKELVEVIQLKGALKHRITTLVRKAERNINGQEQHP